VALFDKKNETFKKKALSLAATFTTPPGRETFRDMLVTSGLLSCIDATDPEAVPRHNMTARLLFEMGILTDDNVEKIVDSLLELCYKE